MMTFWLIIGGMLAAALLCVIPPLLRRDVAMPVDRRELAVAIYRAEQAEAERELKAGNLSAEHYADSQRELERRLIDESGDTSAGAAPTTLNVMRRAGMAAVLLAAIPSAALVLYMRIGNPVAAAVQNGGDTMQGEGHETSALSLDVMVSRLAMRLKRALALTPRDPQLLADYADALAIDPDNPKALALAGSAACDSTIRWRWRLNSRCLHLMPSWSKRACRRPATRRRRRAI